VFYAGNRKEMRQQKAERTTHACPPRGDNAPGSSRLGVWETVFEQGVPFQKRVLRTLEFLELLQLYVAW
jgi:hypothetical protein